MPTATSESSQRVRNANKYLLQAVATGFGLFGLLRLPWIEAHLVLPVTQLQGEVAAAAFNTPAAPISVTLACSGTEVIAMCLGAVLAYPVRWSARALGALLIMAVILGLNTVRIGTLGLAVFDPFWFDALHLYLWPACLALAAAGAVFWWMRLADRTTTRATGSPIAPSWRFVSLAMVLLVLSALTAPMYIESATVHAFGALIAATAAVLLTTVGAVAHATGNILWTSRGGFSVTGDCVATPLVPLYLAAVWVYAPTGLWSTDPIATNTPDGWRFLQTDHLGTPLLAITNSGSTSNQRRMAAFGSTREQGESFSSRFSGQIRDMEKQWVHNLSRELDHRTGRYTSSDPIGLRGGLNIFPYVGSNPIRFSDPLGLQLRMPRIVPPPRGPLPARAPRPDNIPPGRPANDPNYYPPTGGHPLPPVPAPTSPSPASPGDSESQPNPGGRPNGNCTHSRKKELANNVTWECKNKDRPSTCNSYLITCDEILIRAEQARQCRDAREQIMNECFFGGNQKHHDEWEKAYDVEKDCLDRYYFECTDALACI